MNILQKIADLISKQQQLEKRLEDIEKAKTASPVISDVGKSPTPTQPPTPSKPQIDLTAIETQARELLTQAREESAKIREEASRIKEDAYKIKNDSLQKEAEVDRKVGAIEERERLLSVGQVDLTKKISEIEELKKQQLDRLEKIASLSKDDAKNLILDATEKRLSEEVAKKIKDAEYQVKLGAEEKAREILIDAMKHGAVDYVAEFTVSTIRLPDEEMKGRIIGKEGRNIRAIELATGVEVELDETLDIRLSSYDSVRREIAKRSLEKLIKDGRIQPQKIEEIVDKTKQEVDRILAEEGEKLCHSLKVYNLHPDLVKMLGRYKFRSSYGQNMIIHTMEETQIGVAIAIDLKADVAIVRLGCLLHDIGKIVTDEEGSHVQLGADLLRKYRIPEKVVACVEEHHEDKPFSSIESTICWISDAISGSRPGARYEAHEDYVQRMKSVEDAARSFDGVSEAIAYQAGREVRVVIEPTKISDAEMTVLVDKIVHKLQEEAKWAGQIKVTAIRETRTIGVAKN